MSDYPTTPSYGTNYGSRDQTNPPYLPPTYPNQYVQQQDDGRAGQGYMAGNYDTSMSSYAYNKALPSFSAAAVASGVPPLPIYQGWNQDAIPLPPFNPPQPTQYPNYNNNVHNASQFYPSVGHQNYPSSAQPSKPYEQGELSEGEFEDSGLATNTPPAGYGTSQYANSGMSYTDNTSHATYSRAQEFPQQSYPANNYQYPQNPSTQLRRQQSDSYSPYVSPAVGDGDDQYNRERNANTAANSFVQQPETTTTPSQYKPPREVATGPVRPLSQGNGYHSSPKVQHNIPPKPSSTSLSMNTASSVGNGKTVAESRKKAEAAILNLLPYDVRYQTYIDEGFREEFVGPLFDGLKMPRNSVKPSSTTPSHSTPQETSSVVKGKIPTEPRGNASKAQPVTQVRKGALELAIPSTSQQTVTQPTPSAPKSAAMSEKERTLQSKMEALRKSREERAQKQAAAKDVAKPADKPIEKPTVDAAPISEQEPTKTKLSEVAAVSDSPSESPAPAAPKVQPQTASNPIPSNSPASAIVPQIRQQPSIPGLFLASNGIPGLQLSGSNTPTSAVPSTQRKRPVAADFDDAVPAMTPFKRPFGHPRNDRPLVINVSDDEADSEDEDVAMDLDSAGDSPTQPERKMSGNRSAVFQSSGQFSSQINKPFTPPPFPSASNTPPLPSNLSRAVNTPAELERRDREIRDLKRKIAEAEAKKRAKETPSRARTPRLPDAINSETKDTPTANGSASSKAESSTKMQQLVTVAQGQVNLDEQKLAEAQAAEAEKAAELVRNELEQKRLLREKNATNQSLIDAEVLQSRTKLEELRAAMAEAEATYQKSLEEKQRLKEEAERLEQEAELQAKKDRLQDLTNPKISVNTNHLPQFSQAGQTPKPSTTSSPEPASTSTSEEPGQAEEKAPTPVVVTDPSPSENGPIPAEGSVHNLSNGTHNFTNAIQQEVDAQSKQDAIETASADQAMEAALQEAVRADADMQAPEEDDEMDMEMDMEDSYAPDPNHLAPESTSSAVLEEEESPEYSPTLRRTVAEVQDREDDYEPPEAVAPIGDDVPDSPPFSPAPPESLPDRTADEPMDIEPAGPVPPVIPENMADEVNDVNHPQLGHASGHNGAGELLPSVIGSSPNLVEPGSEDVSKTPLYTPYESPLKRFRAYRFHPEFSHDVAGGLRSRTYSHRIDPNKEFCRYELAGGSCNDSTCDLQHFKDIVLQDDAVLTALGSPEEFKNEQRDKFCEGLKGVLMDLRVRKIRDFDIIASEIVAHRAKFLGDTSKVLALDGTNL